MLRIGNSIQVEYSVNAQLILTMVF